MEDGVSTKFPMLALNLLCSPSSRPLAFHPRLSLMSSWELLFHPASPDINLVSAYYFI